MSIESNPLTIGDLHALMDAEFGPCLIRDCPTSVFVRTDLDVLLKPVTDDDPEAAAPRCDGDRTPRLCRTVAIDSR